MILKYPRFSALTNFMVPHIRNGFIPSLMTSYGLIVLTIAIQLVLVPLYIHQLGKEYFGVLTIIFSTINFSSIGVTWVSGGMIRVMGEHAALGNKQQLAHAYALSKFLYVAYALILGLIFWLIAPFTLSTSFHDPQIFYATFLTFVYIVLSLAYSADRLTLTALKYQTRANLFDAAAQIVFAACAIATLYSGVGLMGIAIAQIAGVVTSHVLAKMTWTQKGFDMRLNLPKPEWKQTWALISGPMGRGYALYGTFILILQSDVMIIGAIAGPVYSADYYLLWRIPEIIILILWRIPSALTPYIIHMQARGEQDNIKKIYKWGGIAMASLAAIAALLYASFGHTIVGLWVGNDHTPNAPWGYVLAGIATFFIATAKWPTVIAYALGYIRPLAWAAACELVGKLILIIAFLPFLGYISPIAAVVTVYGLGVFWMYFRAMKKLQ